MSATKSSPSRIYTGVTPSFRTSCLLYTHIHTKYSEFLTCTHPLFLSSLDILPTQRSEETCNENVLILSSLTFPISSLSIPAAKVFLCVLWKSEQSKYRRILLKEHVVRSHKVCATTAVILHRCYVKTLRL